MDISDIVAGNTIQTEKTDFGTTYSQQQQKINSKYKAENNDRYVLFVTSKKASGGQKGYFRLNGQFGYIFANAEDKTPAHEVGHGVFKLEHPWVAYGSKEAKTNLLMDYASGTLLSYLDWKQINDPKLKIYAFQGQEEGELVHNSEFILENNYNFITPNGQIIELPKGTTIHQYCIDINVRNNDFAGFPNGALYGFTTNGKYYAPKFSPNTFNGYYLVKNNQFTNEKYNINKPKNTKTDIVFLHYTAKPTEPHFVNFVKIKNYEIPKTSQNKLVYIKYFDKINTEDIIEAIEFEETSCSNSVIPNIHKGKQKIKVTDKQHIETFQSHNAHIEIYKNKKNGKYEVNISLKGKPKNTKVAEQKNAIEQQLTQIANEKLNELGGLEGRKSPEQKLTTEDGGEFWVKEMNGREWLETIGDLGSSVWENAALPKGYWNKDEGYQQANIHIPPTFAGVSDGVVEEVTNYPQLIKLGYDVATKEDVRNGLWEGIKNIDAESIKNAAVDFYEKKKANYTSDKTYIVNHTVGKDAVQVASLLMGGGAVKGLKNTTDKVDDAIKKVGKEFKEKGTEKVLKTATELTEEIVKNRNEIRKILENDAGKQYAKKYFEKVVKQGDFEKWYIDVFKKYDLGEPLNFEVHHIIPINVLKENEKLQQLFLWAEQNGKKFDFNGLDNGIPLQKKRLKYEITGHANHPKYDIKISEKINEILSDKGLDNLGKYEEMLEIINNTKINLEKDVLLGTKDVNQIINF